MSEAMDEARKIVENFEDVFGDLSATEGDWLARQIANAIQVERNRIPLDKDERAYFESQASIKSQD